MDQIQIGRFIQERRKVVNMTQSDLAERVGITNQAVSKWECGRSVPDASIMMELCDILDISVNGLLCGKSLNEEEVRLKNERNTLTMLITKRELEKLQILIEILIFAGIVITITLTSIMAVTVIEKVVTLIIGCFIWGFGLWMRIKILKVIKDIA